MSSALMMAASVSSQSMITQLLATFTTWSRHSFTAHCAPLSLWSWRRYGVVVVMATLCYGSLPLAAIAVSDPLINRPDIRPRRTNERTKGNGEKTELSSFYWWGRQNDRRALVKLSGYYSLLQQYRPSYCFATTKEAKYVTERCFDMSARVIRWQQNYSRAVYFLPSFPLTHWVDDLMSWRHSHHVTEY